MGGCRGRECPTLQDTQLLLSSLKEFFQASIEPEQVQEVQVSFLPRQGLWELGQERCRGGLALELSLDLFTFPVTWNAGVRSNMWNCLHACQFDHTVNAFLSLTSPPELVYVHENHTYTCAHAHAHTPTQHWLFQYCGFLESRPLFLHSE